jgi:hypothetical protein
MHRYTLAERNDTGSGRAEQKNRNTALISIYADASKSFMVFRGKSKTPRGSLKEL